MSLIPFSLNNTWDPEFISNNFPSPFFSAQSTQVTRKETPTAYLFRAVFPGPATDGDVGALLHIDDDNVLQISSENEDFSARFKLPEDSNRAGIRAAMDGNVFTVTVPKLGISAPNRNMRTIEITGSG